jgi:hypothetical protein
MNSPTVFAFDSHAVRVFTIDGSPWWVATDVCASLGIKNSRQALSRLDGDEKGVISNDTLGGVQNSQIINEPGLYRLMFSSRLPSADRFKRWLAHEVLPQIRKTGAYATTPAPDDMPPDPAAHWLAIIGEARRTFGRKAAAAVWMGSPLRDLIPQIGDQTGLSAFDRDVLTAVFARYEICDGPENTQSAQSVIANVRKELRDPSLSDLVIARALTRALDGYRDPLTGARVHRVKRSSSYYCGLVLKPAFTPSHHRQ